MPESPVVVFKIGGSLLELDDPGRRIEAVLQLRPSARPVLIVGGGRLVDVVRDWSERFALSEVAAHDIAMRTLDATALLVESLMPDLRSCRSVEEVKAAWQAGCRPVIQPDPWFESLPSHALPPGCSSLPKSWDLTSDSLAACIARQLSADELILCKSVDLPRDSTWKSTAAAGLVDCCFPQFAAGLPGIGWVNLRELE